MNVATWEENYQIVNNVTDPEWKKVIDLEMSKPYFTELVEKIAKSHKPFEGEFKIFPPKHLIFNAFNKTKLCNIKVCIISQDPYHGENQANGLCFAVNKGNRVPPSLRNIYKEINEDPNNVPPFEIPDHGDLTGWAEQGVLLLNTSLTVRQGNAGSHSRFGWVKFTDNIIKHISSNCQDVVFLLWGRHAIGKQKLIDGEKHVILTAVHPSPLSARRGFFGCKHFSKTNEIMKKQGKKPIDWNRL